MLETKGRVDIDVPLKIRVADAWAACASHSSLDWSNLYVPQEVFAKIDDICLELSDPCASPPSKA